MIKIYTDGSCLVNCGGQGGWAAVSIHEDERTSEISGNEEHTTNNRMELMAVIKSLNRLTGKQEVAIYTDSEYVKNGITLWIHSWKQNNWRNSNNKPVKNKDLWIELERACLRHEVEFFWVKAHNGDKYNCRADFLAKKKVLIYLKKKM